MRQFNAWMIWFSFPVVNTIVITYTLYHSSFYLSIGQIDELNILTIRRKCGILESTLQRKETGTMVKMITKRKSYAFRELSVNTLLPHLVDRDVALIEYRNEPLGYFVPFAESEDDALVLFEKMLESWRKRSAIKPRVVKVMSTETAFGEKSFPDLEKLLEEK